MIKINNEQREYDPNVIGEISQINRKEREKIGDAAYEENLRIEALTNTMYNQSEEFKVIKEKLDQQYNSTNSNNKRDSEINKIYIEENSIKATMKQKILNMSGEEREQLRKNLTGNIRAIIFDNSNERTDE